VTTTTALLSVLIVVATATCGVAVWALLESVKMARSVKTLADDLDERVVPFVDKADVTLDAINAELLRIDAIVTRFEDIGQRVDETSKTVQDAANAPVEIVTDLADRVRRAWRSRKHAGQHGAAQSREPEGASPTDASEA